jgi:dephospho-CoA kinase
MFAELGGHVIAADQLGHEALREPAIREQVLRRWGEGILNSAGEVDRKKLAAIVFADVKERRALEAMVFPWIERRIREEKAKGEADPSILLIVLDAAILLETGWGELCDAIVYVHAPREQRLARLKSGRGWTEEEVAAREHAQLPAEEKSARADFQIDNSGSVEATRRQVEELFQLIARHE